MAAANMEGGEAVTLNIMPLLDVFSILVTFLLMSFSAEPTSYESGVELPLSTTTISLDEVPAIEVTKDVISIQDKPVVTLKNGQVPERDQTQGAIYPVFKELEKLAQANARARRRSNSLEKKDTDTLTMVMDKQHKFELMKMIMLSAQQAEFITFKLVVNKDQI